QLRDPTFIVCGYSGRDQSVMSALSAAYSVSGAGRLYWCGVGDDEPPAAAKALLECARANGHEAFYVPTKGFDDLIVRLALQCLDGELADRSRDLYTEVARERSVEPEPFEVESRTINALAKSNAFPVTLPSEVFQFDATGVDTPGAWKRVAEWTAGSRVVAV